MGPLYQKEVKLDKGNLTVLIAIIAQSTILISAIWKLSKWTTKVDITMSEFRTHVNKDDKFQENITEAIQDINLKLAKGSHSR